MYIMTFIIWVLNFEIMETFICSQLTIYGDLCILLQATDLLSRHLPCWCYFDQNFQYNQKYSFTIISHEIRNFSFILNLPTTIVFVWLQISETNFSCLIFEFSSGNFTQNNCLIWTATLCRFTCQCPSELC